MHNAGRRSDPPYQRSPSFPPRLSDHLSPDHTILVSPSVLLGGRYLVLSVLLPGIMSDVKAADKLEHSQVVLESETYEELTEEAKLGRFVCTPH